jgi:hypothetical protein
MLPSEEKGPKTIIRNTTKMLMNNRIFSVLVVPPGKSQPTRLLRVIMFLTSTTRKRIWLEMPNMMTKSKLDSISFTTPFRFGI